MGGLRSRSGRSLGEQLRTIADRQEPFATSLALNRTLGRAQRRMQGRMGEAFTLREPRSERLFERAVKVRPEDRATKQAPRIRLRIEAPEDGAGKRPLQRMFEDFEAGAVRGPSEIRYGNLAIRRSNFVPIPVGARPLKTSVIPRSEYPSALGLALRTDGKLEGPYRADRTSKTKRGDRYLKRVAERRLYVERTDLPDPKDWGIYKRVGPRGPKGGQPRGLQLWWAYRRSTYRPAILRLRDTFEAECRAAFPDEMRRAWSEAIRTAR